MRKAKRNLPSAIAGLALVVMALNTSVGGSTAPIAPENVHPIALLGAGLVGLGGLLLMRTPRSTS